MIMRDKNMKTKTVKVYGPWINGHRTVKEISLDEWNSFTPLNRLADARMEAFNGGYDDLAGHCDGAED